MSATRKLLELFDRVDFTFKTVNDHPIETTILIPKALQSKPRAEYPTIVNWHGGAFIVGDRMYEGWIPPWLLDLALSTPAIYIAPDYRLLPESNPTEILSDVEDFWKWLHNTLPTLTLTWPAYPDLTHLTCTGQSSGGNLAVLSALKFPHLVKIKVLIVMGSPLNSNNPDYSIPRPKVILGKWPPPPPKAERMVRSYVKGVEKGAVRTKGDVVEMWEFLTCVLQQAYLPRWLGRGRGDWNVMKLLEVVDEVPPIWVVQGEQDSVVLPICTIGFVDKLKERFPDNPVLLALQPGDHSFEVLHSVDDEWVREGFEFVGKYWPGASD